MIIVTQDEDELLELMITGVDIEDELGRIIVQKDYRVRGDVWQVHKTDADPFPSRPHAHCVEGKAAYQRAKLHLGTRELFRGARSLGLFYPAKHFAELCAKIQSKFPDISFPLKG